MTDPIAVALSFISPLAAMAGGVVAGFALGASWMANNTETPCPRWLLRLADTLDPGWRTRAPKK